MIYFSYIYFTNAFSALNPIALFQKINQQSYGFTFTYSTFAFIPTEETTMLALKSYSSSATPFFPMPTSKDFTINNLPIDSFRLGYSNVSGLTNTFSGDILFINNSFTGCG